MENSTVPSDWVYDPTHFHHLAKHGCKSELVMSQKRREWVFTDTTSHFDEQRLMDHGGRAHRLEWDTARHFLFIVLWRGANKFFAGSCRIPKYLTKVSCEAESILLRMSSI